MALSADLLLRHMSDAVLRTDGNWRVTLANGRAESLLRRSEKELVGRALADCLPDLAGSRAEGQLAQLPRNSAVERRIDHFSPSRYTWFEMRVVSDGVGGTVFFLRDVTERVRQTRSEAVREALREVLMEAPIALSITRGPEHRYELLNTMARRLISGRNVEGMTVRAAFPEIDPALFDILDRVYQTGTPFEMQDLAVRFDRAGNGQLVEATFDVVYQPMYEADGSVSGILNISVETTGEAKAGRAASG